MTTHITLTTFIVFFAMAAFGAVVFTLAHFASRGVFSPNVPDDDTPPEEEAVTSDAADEATAATRGLSQHDACARASARTRLHGMATSVYNGVVMGSRRCHLSIT